MTIERYTNKKEDFFTGMNYNKKLIKDGITFHKITTNKFKTNLFSIFITTPLSRENVTKNALISAVLRMGTTNIPAQDLISKELENMYGASFDCGVEKNGDNQILKFYIESINDEFLPEQSNLAQKSLQLLADIVFNPLVENNGFKAEFVESEKNTLRRIIESKIDNKTRYALDRCVEEMYKSQPYGLYKYGYIEDLDSITGESLYSYYKELINTCKIDIFASGINMDNLNEDEILANLNARSAHYLPSQIVNITNEINEPKAITEKMDVTQGKLIMGLDILNMKDDENFSASVYNIVLGGGANSKLFQNVREKASLAYTAGSSYQKNKSNIFIRCGIEINNYEKAVEIIKEQLNQIKNADFSDDDIESAKQLLYATLKGIEDSQDAEISYYFSQELSGKFINVEDNIAKIKAVTKEQIIEIAKRVQINTVYFLTGENFGDTSKNSEYTEQN